jgi:hypothetical protein
MTNHDPTCIDHYIDDFQILLLKQDGQPLEVNYKNGEKSSIGTVVANM